jgi:hypothetical protein
MQDDQRMAFATLISDALAFYRQHASDFALSVWWAACQPFDLEQVSAALTAHAMDPERGQFPPMPADIVRALQGTQTDRAMIAWGKVMEGMQRVGAYQSVAFDDPIVHAVVTDLGGWPLMCQVTIDELPFLSRRFCDAYRAYARRPSVSYPRYLAGVSELENRRAGFKTAGPVLIGDPLAATDVIRKGGDGPKTAITEIKDAMRIERTDTKRITA